MSPLIARVGIRLGLWDCILNAKSGFSLDRLQTFFKGCQTTISGAASEICAPLSVFLTALCLCAVSERAPDNKAGDRY
jgi:hypothetical protein